MNSILKRKTPYTYLNIYKSYQETLNSSKNKDNYITREYQKNPQLPDLNDLEVSDRLVILNSFCAFSIKKRI